MCCLWCLCGKCRGARCCPSSVPPVPLSPVLCGGVVLALCLPCPLPCARPLLGCWLPPVFCVVLSPFSLLSVGSPSSLACTSSLPPFWCVPRSFSFTVSLVLVPGSSSFSPVGSCETGEGWGCVGLRAAARFGYNVTYLQWSPYPCWRQYRCVLRCVACNIPVSALVSTCVRTLFTLLAIPWCLSVAVAVALRLQ